MYALLLNIIKCDFNEQKLYFSLIQAWILMRMKIYDGEHASQ